MGGKEGKQYLRFTAIEDGTFQYPKALEYSLDNGSTWVSLAANTATPTVQAGNDIIWRGTYTPGNAMNNFSSTAKFNASGDVRSIVFGENFENKNLGSYGAYSMFRDNVNIVSAYNLILTDPSSSSQVNVYRRMFQGCTSLVEAPKSLPTLLAVASCQQMFYNCSSLITAPQLQATTLTTGCYQEMFYGCSSLVTPPPSLPATVAASSCYASMFYNCSALTSTPTISATTLASSCYQSMFYGCSSITSLNFTLPCTTLAANCYDSMFLNCSSLVTPPSLPAETLATGCYYRMFQGCTNITTTPSLPAQTLAEACYRQMFQGCTNITTAPVLPALTLVPRCYASMFYNCNSLNYIKAMFTSDPTSVTSSLDNWVRSVASSGTFVKNSLSTFNTRGASGIPNNWTIETADS